MRNSLTGLMKIKQICRSLGESYVLFQTKPTNFLPPWNAKRNPDLSAVCWKQKNLFVLPTLDFPFVSSQRASWWDTRSPVHTAGCTSSSAPQLSHTRQTFHRKALLASQSFWLATRISYLCHLFSETIALQISLHFFQFGHLLNV